MLKQPLHQPLPVEKQVVILYALTHGYLDKVDVADIARFQSELFDNFDANHADLLDTIKTTGNLPADDDMKAAISAFADSFQPTKAAATDGTK